MLGIVFAHFDAWLALFGAVTAVALWLLPRFAPWFFGKVVHRTPLQMINTLLRFVIKFGA